MSRCDPAWEKLSTKAPKGSSRSPQRTTAAPESLSKQEACWNTPRRSSRMSKVFTGLRIAGGLFWWDGRHPGTVDPLWSVRINLNQLVRRTQFAMPTPSQGWQGVSTNLAVDDADLPWRCHVFPFYILVLHIWVKRYGQCFFRPRTAIVAKVITSETDFS